MFLALPNIAHAFGQTYALPIAPWLFLFAAAACIILSYIVISWLVDPNPPKIAGSTRSVSVSRLIPILKTFGVIMFWLMISTGLLAVGSSSFIVVCFWVSFLIGFTYVVVLCGDIWQYINPFRTMYEGLERLLGTQRHSIFKYPQRLSYYPALVTYVGLIWLEFLSSGLGIVPDRLAYILLLYFAWTMTAAWLFGKEIWFRYGEFFSVFFRIVSHVSPIVIDKQTARTRPPFAGIYTGESVRVGMLLIILFMLASTVYDTFRETKLFRTIAEFLLGTTANITWLYELVFLGAVLFLLLGLYLVGMWLMRQLIQTELSSFELARRFALTLLPISIGYHIAHYFLLLVMNGSLTILYLSDPFQFGWNIGGLASLDLVPEPFNVAHVWYFQVTVILGTHIAALYAAHRTATRLFHGTPARIARSQYPIVGLMILYTVGSLWLLTLTSS